MSATLRLMPTIANNQVFSILSIHGDSITFVGEELCDSNEPQNIEIRTAAKPLS